MQIEDLYLKATGTRPERVTPLTPAGSNRRYFRLHGTTTLIGVEGTDRAENEAFIYLAGHFAVMGLPVPRVMAVSPDRMCYLVSDLGDTPLFACLDNMDMLRAAMRRLAEFHYIGSRGIDYSRCYPVEAFDATSAGWDLNYFKYSFLNTSGITYSEPRLEEDFRRLAADVADITASDGVFMYRDFQSRNVMIHEGAPWFIDFQGGRKGPAAYDVASFVNQAKAGFTPDVKEILLTAYMDRASELRPDFNSDEFCRQLRLMSLIRSLQTLGAYGFRGRIQGKPHFLQSIPPALESLRKLVAEPFGRYPYLMEVIDTLTAPAPALCPESGLTVRVTSFSYKRGIPSDPSGNGGGFVFDCRAMDNPGRYQEYRQLTGLDRPVIDFLEKKGEITRFLESVYSLVDAAVTNYLKRGFTSLAINFGCTGGQHRSVYSAEHTARHLKSLFPEAHIILTHREQGISESL